VTAAFKAIGVLRQRMDGLERRLDRRWFPRCLWGHSQATENARTLFARLATTDHPVVVAGEPGTGRREVARALHAFSPRKSRDLVSIVCNDQPPERLKLDLFGCVAGAHPSIVKNRLGWLEIARGSSIVLDAVESLPLDVQRALLDAIESGQFWRIGSEMPAPLDVRFLAIARQDLRQSASTAIDARFSEWLGCFTIVLPPLRERADDLPSLIDETLRMIEIRSNATRKSLDPSAFRTLADHHWPGNLRELNSVLERAVLACPGDVIGNEHLPPLGAKRRPDPVGSFGSEKDWILSGLKHNRFRRGQTADYLGISRKTLYNKMRAYGFLPADEIADGRGPLREHPRRMRHDA
jgi:DNA-binding NtrC family response regulator